MQFLQRFFAIAHVEIPKTKRSRFGDKILPQIYFRTRGVPCPCRPRSSTLTSSGFLRVPVVLVRDLKNLHRNAITDHRTLQSPPLQRNFDKGTTALAATLIL